MIKNIIIGVLAVAIVVMGIQFFQPQLLGIGEATGPTHYQVEAFLQGFYVGTGRQANINNAGLLTTSGGITNTGTLTQSGTLTLSGTVTSSGSLTQTGAFTASADVRLKSPVSTGLLGGIAGTSSSLVTAAQVCDLGIATTTPSITESSTLTLPSATTLFSDCLTTNGDSKTFYVLNTTASTTVVTAGASTTLVYDGSTGGSATLAASSMAIIRFLRTGTEAMYAVMDQYKP